MTFYIDENISTSLAEAFNILQQGLNDDFKKYGTITVKSVVVEFGAGTEDEVWIPLAGKGYACIITQDYNIHKTKLQRELSQQHRLGMFYLRPPSKTGFKYWDMVKVLVTHWEQMNKIALRESRPFAYKITSKGKMEAL